MKNLCKLCDDKDYCLAPCPDSLEDVELGPEFRTFNKDYKPKGVPIFAKSGSQMRKDKARIGGLKSRK